MPQLQLPIFPAGATLITPEIGFECAEGKVVYVYGHLPVFQHEEKDLTSFRLFTSQLIINGTVGQADIVRAFHVTAISVKRYVKKYRKSGMQGFFAPQRRRAGGVLTGEVIEKAQALLDEGKGLSEIGHALDVLPDTLQKAIQSKRLRRLPKKRG